MCETAQEEISALFIFRAKQGVGNAKCSLVRYHFSVKKHLTDIGICSIIKKSKMNSGFQTEDVEIKTERALTERPGG